MVSWGESWRRNEQRGSFNYVQVVCIIRPWWRCSGKERVCCHSHLTSITPYQFENVHPNKACSSNATNSPIFLHCEQVVHRLYICFLYWLGRGDICWYVICQETCLYNNVWFKLLVFFSFLYFKTSLNILKKVKFYSFKIEWQVLIVHFYFELDR